MADATVKLRNVKTPRALGCYVTLAKPRAMEAGKDPEYSIALLWPKTTDLSDIRKAIEEAAISKFGPAAPKLLGTKLKTPLKDGNLKVNDDGVIDPIYKDKWFVNARSKQRIPIVDHTLATVDPNEVYSGCFFHAQLRFYPFDWNKGQSRGVGCGLQNLMLVGRGKRIDGRETAEQAFKDFVPEVTEDDGDVGDLIG
jgi:Protein of unknown function (DUF2815)